jgi:hypothetical protein
MLESDIRAIKHRALQLYNQHCVDNNITVYAPQLGHGCTHGCERWYFQSSVFRAPVSVCVESRTVHVCGNGACNTAEMDHAAGCYVCPLTRLCFSNVYEHHVTHSRSTPGARVGNHHGPESDLSRKGTSRKRRALTSPKNLDTMGRYECIRRCLMTYLTDSSERRTIYRSQLERFYREDIKQARAHYRTNKPVAISSVFLEIEQNIAKMGKLLNPPSTRLAPEHIAALASSFNDYFKTVCTVAQRSGTDIVSTERQIKIFVASMCHFLSEGFHIGSTTIIPKDEWFSFHALHVKMYGEFSNQQCRNMSKFERQFKEICIAPSTQSALYELCYTLPVSFTSRWQRRSHAFDDSPAPTHRAQIAATSSMAIFPV